MGIKSVENSADIKLFPEDKRERELLQDILANIGEVETMSSVSGLDDAGRKLAGIRKQLGGLLKEKSAPPTPELILEGYRIEAIRLFGSLCYAVDFYGPSGLDDEALYRLMLTAEFFCRHTATYFEKKDEAGRLIDEKS